MPSLTQSPTLLADFHSPSQGTIYKLTSAPQAVRFPFSPRFLFLCTPALCSVYISIRAHIAQYHSLFSCWYVHKVGNVISLSLCSLHLHMIGSQCLLTLNNTTLLHFFLIYQKKAQRLLYLIRIS